MVSPKGKKPTGAKSHRDRRHSMAYVPPPLRPAVGLDVHLFQCWKQVSTGEYAIEVLPTIGHRRYIRVVVMDDSDIVHFRERRKAFERFTPKHRIGLVGLRSDGERFQGPFVLQMIHECFNPVL